MSTMFYRPRQCKFCDVKPVVMELDKNAFYNWQKGMFVQDAFPNLNAGEREILMTGIHDECWDKMFPEDDDSEFDYTELPEN